MLLYGIDFSCRYSYRYSITGLTWREEIGLASSAFCSFFALAAKIDFYSRLASTKIKASGVFWPFLAKIDAFGGKPEGIDYSHRQFNIIDVYCIGYTSPQSLILNCEVSVYAGEKTKFRKFCTRQLVPRP